MNERTNEQTNAWINVFYIRLGYFGSRLWGKDLRAPGNIGRGVGKWDREGKVAKTGHINDWVMTVGTWNSLLLDPLGDTEEHALELSHLKYKEAVYLIPMSLLEAAHGGS